MRLIILLALVMAWVTKGGGRPAQPGEPGSDYHKAFTMNADGTRAGGWAACYCTQAVGADGGHDGVVPTAPWSPKPKGDAK